MRVWLDSAAQAADEDVDGAGELSDEVRARGLSARAVAETPLPPSRTTAPARRTQRTGIQAPEATGNHYYQPNYYSTVSWGRPVTNRLLFEGGVGFLAGSINGKRLPETQPTPSRSSSSRSTASTGRASAVRASPAATRPWERHERLAVSYITGSHSFKTGVNFSRFSQMHRSTNNFEMQHGARRFGSVES